MELAANARMKTIWAGQWVCALCFELAAGHVRVHELWFTPKRHYAGKFALGMSSFDTLN